LRGEIDMKEIQRRQGEPGNCVCQPAWLFAVNSIKRYFSRATSCFKWEEMKEKKKTGFVD